MLRLIFSLLVIFITNLYAEKLLLQNERYVIYTTEDSSKIDMNRVNFNLAKISALDSVILRFENDFYDCNKIVYPVKLTIMVKTDNTIVYNSNFIEYQFFGNNYISTIYSKLTCKDVDSAITSGELLKRSKHFFEEILDIYGKKNEIKYFDSISIGTVNNWYVVNFHCKQKNDVFDNRYAELFISIKTGKLFRFTCEFYNKYDLNYKPQISKKEAINKIAEKFSINTSDIIIKEMYLKQVKRFDKARWVWETAIYIQKGKEKLFIFLYLDSITGEINIMNNW